MPECNYLIWKLTRTLWLNPTCYKGSEESLMTTDGQDFMSTPHLKDDDNQQGVPPVTTQRLKSVLTQRIKATYRIHQQYLLSLNASSNWCT